MNKKQCKFCGRDLYAKRKDANYCDVNCQSSYRYERQQAVKLNKIKSVLENDIKQTGQ